MSRLTRAKQSDDVAQITVEKIIERISSYLAGYSLPYWQTLAASQNVSAEQAVEQAVDT